MAVESFSEGTIPFHIDSINTTAKTYYKVFGDLQSSKKPPVLVLHGGPGSGHEYCLPFHRLWSLYGIPVIFYDQVGCAASTHFRDKAGDETFWHPDLFVAELRNVIKNFNLDREDGPGFDLLGHSWGSILAHYFASHQPLGLRRLILASGTASGELFAKGLWEKTRQLSKETQQAIEEAVQKNDFTGSAYAAAVGDFMDTFLCRAKPPPPELLLDHQHQQEDTTVRHTLIGSSPWNYDGLLRRWDSTIHTHKITATALMLTGEFDTSPDWVCAPIFEGLAKVHWITISGGSHMYQLDSPELQDRTLKIVGDFLQPGC